METDSLRSKSDLIYEELSTQIRSGVYPAGTKLPRESLFARQQGVALLTLRSALARLEADGLIARLPRSGTFVMNPADGRPRTILLRLEDYNGNPLREKEFNRNLILGAANSAYLQNWELKLSDCSEEIDRLKLRYRKGEFLGIVWDRPPRRMFPRHRRARPASGSAGLHQPAGRRGNSSELRLLRGDPAGHAVPAQHRAP